MVNRHKIAPDKCQVLGFDNSSGAFRALQEAFQVADGIYRTKPRDCPRLARRVEVSSLKLVYTVSGLTKVYKKGKVLANDQIDLDVREGEIMAILGPNGAGKTTLVKQMVGHIHPTHGSITLLDHDVVQQPDWAPTVAAYYPQVPLALKHLTTMEALTFTGCLRGLRTAEAKRQACELIAQLGLEAAVQRQLGSLSGGQQRLVGIGTALIGRLPILVFDEPTNELDPANRRLVWETLRYRNQTEGTTVLVVTHNVLEAELVVDRVAIMDRGHLLALDTLGTLKRQVDQRLHLEVTLTPGPHEQAKRFLQPYGALEYLSDTRWRLKLDKAAVGLLLTKVVALADELGFEEYRLIPPSLEDVYFAVGGKEVLHDD